MSLPPDPPPPPPVNPADARAILLALLGGVIALLLSLQCLEKWRPVPCMCGKDPPCAVILSAPASEIVRARESGERFLRPGHPCPPGYAVVHRTASYLRIAPAAPGAPPPTEPP